MIILANYKRLNISLEQKTYCFYNEIAEHLNKPIENILSETLCKYVELIEKRVSEETKYGSYNISSPKREI